MLRILLVTTRTKAMNPFTESLSTDPQVQLDLAASGSEALTAVHTSSPHLVIIDQELPDTEPSKLVPELIMVNAMVNTAVVSSLSEEEFHEASEGLGILARLPLEPGREDAADLLNRLKKVVGPVQ